MGYFGPVIRAPLSVHFNALELGRSGFLTVRPEESSIQNTGISAVTAPTEWGLKEYMLITTNSFDRTSPWFDVIYGFCVSHSEHFTTLKPSYKCIYFKCTCVLKGSWEKESAWGGEGWWGTGETNQGGADRWDHNSRERWSDVAATSVELLGILSAAQGHYRTLESDYGPPIKQWFSYFSHSWFQQPRTLGRLQNIIILMDGSAGWQEWVIALRSHLLQTVHWHK